MMVDSGLANNIAICTIFMCKNINYQVVAHLIDRQVFQLEFMVITQNIKMIQCGLRFVEITSCRETIPRIQMFIENVTWLQVGQKYMAIDRYTFSQ